MGKDSGKSFYRDKDFSSLGDRLTYYKDKIQKQSIKPFILKGMHQLALDKELGYYDTLRCLDILSFALINNKDSNLDKTVTQEIVFILPNLAFLNKKFPSYNYHEGFWGNDSNPENIFDYYKNIELEINNIDKSKSVENKNKKFALLSEGLREVSKNLYDWVPPYDGNNLKISPRVGKHFNSVLIMPEDPKEAVSALFGDNIRTVFAEYDEKESAETYVQNYYGKDGLYAEHYRMFLDCKKRYPGQASILV